MVAEQLPVKRRIPCAPKQLQVPIVILNRQRRHTEAQAREKGHEIKVKRFPFIGNGKAIALASQIGETIFIKNRANCWAPMRSAPR